MNVKKIEKFHMDSEKSITSFEMKKRIDQIKLKLIIVNKFLALLLCKINDSFDIGNCFRFLLYLELLKF